MAIYIERSKVFSTAAVLAISEPWDQASYTDRYKVFSNSLLHASLKPWDQAIYTDRHKLFSNSMLHALIRTLGPDHLRPSQHTILQRYLARYYKEIPTTEDEDSKSENKIVISDDECR